ncbi:MAG: TonB-dependent receptor [Verrucomicrobiota bacterium JB022]|nr:TonB-dependent receptor [Verrucomicrobiota bacterium JB022]
MAAPALFAQESSEELELLDTFTASGRVTEPFQAVGFDSVRATTVVTRDALLAAPPGISGLKMLESIPGVVMSNSDANGLYEFGNQLLVRAFGFEQLGFTLDGIPMGRTQAFGGSPIYRYVDNENLEEVVASQGSGDVTVPGYVSLGPSFQYFTATPSEEFEPHLEASYGSNDYTRLFAKINVGEIAPGLTGYYSISSIKADYWRGPNENDRIHMEGKLNWEVNDKITMSALYVYNDFEDGDYRFLGLADYRNFGRYFDYIDYMPVAPGLTMATDDVSYDYAAARAAYQADPQANLGAFFVAVPDGIPDNLQERTVRDASGNVTGTISATARDENGYVVTDEYRGHINARTDNLFGYNFDFDVTEDVNLHATLYYEDKLGDGVSYDDFDGEIEHYIRQTENGFSGLSAPQGVLWGLTHLEGERYGGRLDLDWEIGEMQLVEAGFWYEQDEFYRNTTRYNIRDGLAQPQALFDQPVFRIKDFTQTTDSMQFYLKDTISLMEDRLKIEIGVKALDLDVELTGFRSEEDYDVWARKYTDADYMQNGARLDAGWDDYFLPAAGVTYNLTDTMQVFASYTESMASPTAESEDVLSYGDPRNMVIPEAQTSKNYDIGFRTNFSDFSSSIALYYVDFGNKLENVGYFDPEQNETFNRYETAGSVEAYGLEVALSYVPSWARGDLAVTSSLLINEAEYGTSDLTVVGTPDWTLSTTVTYSFFESLVASVSANYMGERPMNTSSTGIVGSGTLYAEAYTTVDAYLEVRFAPLLGERYQGFSLRINGTNLTDEDALGNIFSSGGRPIQDRAFSATLRAVF